MTFRTPLPFKEALESRAARSVLPTDFRTRLLQEIPAEIRERSFFSAGVTNADFLDRANSSIDDLVSGQVDRATKRLELKKLLESLQYRPVEGEEGTLTDLSSDSRLNLILDTNLEQAQGYGRFAQGQQQDILDRWPAQELVRVIDTKHHRDWASRWSEAGGEFYGGRMIALKNDPVWENLGNDFDDSLGNPYPPFAFNSGMDVQDVDREEAIELGLIERDTELLPQSRGLNDGLEASPELAPGLKDELLSSLADNGIVARFVGGVLRYIGGSN